MIKSKLSSKVIEIDDQRQAWLEEQFKKGLVSLDALKPRRKISYYSEDTYDTYETHQNDQRQRGNFTNQMNWDMMHFDLSEDEQEETPRNQPQKIQKTLELQEISPYVLGGEDITESQIEEPLQHLDPLLGKLG